MKRVELRRKKPWRPKIKPREPRTDETALTFKGITFVEDASVPPGKALVVKPRSTLKPSKPKSTPARKAAKGKPCMIRLPGCYEGPENETVVLCHYSMSGISGAGLKSPDEIAAFGCHHCHGVVDGRLPPPTGYTKKDVQLAFAEGVMRTLVYMKYLHRD